MADSSRDVNDILHTLRGEHYRHLQNVRRSQSYLLANRTHNVRTLPAGVASLTRDREQLPPNEIPPALHAGPGPPRSWVRGPIQPAAPQKISRKGPRDTPAWRASVLSLIYAHLSSPVPIFFDNRFIKVDGEKDDDNVEIFVPPLTLILLRDLISTCSAAEFMQHVLPYLPLHLRRQILFDSAIYAPLSNAKLYPLCEPNGYVQNELVVVGPFATLRIDDFRIVADNKQPVASQKQEDMSWESSLHDEWTPVPLHTLIMLSANISVSTFLTLPLTLTHLALIDLPAPVPVYRLTTLCPLLAVLDLSYNNHWIHSTSATDSSVFDRIQWDRWRSLRVLGLRDCTVESKFYNKLNKGRWEDVQVVL